MKTPDAKLPAAGFGGFRGAVYLDDAERVREQAGLLVDRSDRTYSRMLASDGSVWPAHDTGYRHRAATK
jgi:hypothetical protein